jgi:hypothetical protein
MAAVAIAACAFSDAAAAGGPFGAYAADGGLSLFAASSHGASEAGLRAHWEPYRALATAGTTVRGVGGWTARLFVSYLGPRHAADDEQVRMRSSTVVNAQVMHRLSPSTRITFDVFNVFDHRGVQADPLAASRLGPMPGAMENFLFHPAEPRGFRLKLRVTF